MRIRKENFEFSMPTVELPVCMTAALLAITFMCSQQQSIVALQSGFISLSCGGQSNFTDENGIFWIPDSQYIQTGVSASLNNSLLDKSIQHVRYFPGPRNKSCYVLPVASSTTYIVRARFYYGNYDGLNKLPNFYILFNANYWGTVEFNDAFEGFFYELILFSGNSTSVSVCTARISPAVNPFISSLELRPLTTSMYNIVQSHNLALRTESRYDIGSNASTVIRFPYDPYDRIWESDYGLKTTYLTLSTRNPVINGRTGDIPPSFVMQTAKTTIDATTLMYYQFLLPQVKQSYYIALYFAEIQSLGANETRIFDIYYYNNLLSSNLYYSSLDVASLALGSFATVEIYANNSILLGTLNFSFVPGQHSTLGPILNAAEVLSVLDNLTSGTYYEDVSALVYIQTLFNLLDWSGDPCLPIGYNWDWVECDTELVPRVTTLKLSGMDLNGSIPQSIAELKALTTILLDGNNLTGSIPDLSRLISLQTLDLQNNSLTGTIPGWLATLQNLTELYLQNNNLSGTVPTNLRTKAGLDIGLSGNPYLCLEPGSCFSPIQSPIPSQAPQIVNSQPSKKTNHLGLILGIAAGGIIASVLLVASIFFYCRGSGTQKPGSFKGVDSSAPSMNGDVFGVADTKTSRDRSQEFIFNFEEIRGCTKGFQRKIGEGGFGPVYYGKLSDGREVAVKVLATDSHQGAAEFINEVELLSRVHHRYLVSLLGYCNESDQKILVYEYMPKGTLRDNLYGAMPQSQKSLSWKMRLNIALNAAQGLEYLHTGCHPRIIHRDIKSSNILLSKTLTAKVSDFGLSKLATEDETSHIFTVVKGTAGYLDPEYYLSNQLGEKSDVFSFGVVLLEIICGREPVKMNVPREEMNLVEWVRKHLQEGEIHEVVDPFLRSTYKMEAMWKVAEIAIVSAEPRGMYRPTMAEVVQELKAAIQIENGTSMSFSDQSNNGPVFAGRNQYSPNLHSMDILEHVQPSFNNSSAFSTELEGR
ncbi:hypothetical protein O6H91_15G019400 [Diphasiastrum complanatum]|uniref:Uncharacterized protein n=1 Tax=Diphasiastrum complanatum TaxID=34168 RepID=A0ACC2BG59_DIPCM|nr:hypothetical protein O6H91_15G019400 [Diphasiastrum complanatum]